MITVRRAGERRRERLGERDVWHTFPSRDPAGSLPDGFGALEMLNEECLPPGTEVPRHEHRDAEVVTYVSEGAMAHVDSEDRSVLVQAGEFQRRTVGRGYRHRERNASETEWARIFQMSLRPAEAGLPPGHEEKRFVASDRRGQLCVVASPDGREGSLRVHLDALVLSAILENGLHLVHGLAPGRRAWLHLVNGGITVDGYKLFPGDGAGVRDERAISVTATEDSEILLLDVGADAAVRP